MKLESINIQKSVFIPGGKKCPGCGKRIYHDRWNITPKLAEDRWSHKEAKNRELSEVVDFLGDCA